MVVGFGANRTSEVHGQPVEILGGQLFNEHAFAIIVGMQSFHNLLGNKLIINHLKPRFGQLLLQLPHFVVVPEIGEKEMASGSENPLNLVEKGLYVGVPVRRFHIEQHVECSIAEGQLLRVALGER